MRHVLTLVAVLVSLLVAGSSPAADSTGPIRVGGLFAESGPAAFVGTPSRLVAEMAVEEINAAGGILGRPLELVTFDTESDAGKALLGARKLIEQDGAFVLIGPTSTGSGMAVKKYTEQAQVPILMTVGGDPVIAGGKFGPYAWTFKVPQRTSVAVQKIYSHLKDQGVTKVGLLTATDGFGRDGKAHLERVAQEMGFTVVASEVMDPKGADFSAQAFKLAVAKPQAVIVWTIGPAGAIATRNFRALPGEQPLIVQSHGQPGPKFVELAGPAAEGVLMPGTKLMAAGALTDDDPQKEVVQGFAASYVGRGLDAEFPLNTHSGYAYDAMLLLKAGLEKAGAVDRAALREALQQLSGVVGISGVFSLAPEDHNGLNVDSLVMLTVTGGEYVPAK